MTATATTAPLRVPGADGVAVAVHRWGTPGELPPVYLQHGFVADTRLNWVGTGTVAALLAAGREVVGIDARGHGRSDKPHDPAAYGELRMAGDLRGVADALGHDSFDLAGYSMGATIAMLVAAAVELSVEDLRRIAEIAPPGVAQGGRYADSSYAYGDSPERAA